MAETTHLMGTQLGAYLEMKDDYFILIMKNR